MGRGLQGSGWVAAAAQQEQQGGAFEVGGGVGGAVAAAEHLADDDAVVQGQRRCGPAGRPGRSGATPVRAAAVSISAVSRRVQRRRRARGGRRPPRGAGRRAARYSVCTSTQVRSARNVDRHRSTAAVTGSASCSMPVSCSSARARLRGGLPGEQGGEQLVLGAEAGVEGAAGEAAAAADVLDAGRGEADLGEGLQRRVEQPLDRLRPAAPGALDDGHDAGLYWIRPCIRTTRASDVSRRVSRPSGRRRR